MSSVCHSEQMKLQLLCIALMCLSAEALCPSQLRDLEWLHIVGHFQRLQCCLELATQCVVANVVPLDAYQLDATNLTLTTAQQVNSKLQLAATEVNLKQVHLALFQVLFAQAS